MKRIIYIYGPQGSGKTEALRSITRMLPFYDIDFENRSSRALLADAHDKIRGLDSPNISIDGFVESESLQGHFVATWHKRGSWIIICSQYPPSSDFKIKYMPVILKAETFNAA